MDPILRFDVLSLFPKTLDGFVGESIIARAIDSGLVEINSLDLRRWAKGKHRETDDRPFGGGAGMVMKPEPLFSAVEDISSDSTTVIYMAPDGEKLDTPMCKELAQEQHILIISGHYEGVDQRVIDKYVDEEISIGDFVLSGGEYAAICLIDAVSRHIPGVLGNKDSYLKDTFSDGLLKGNVYTKPEIFESMRVPEVLLSGNHKEIEKWKTENSLVQTLVKRPDLLNKKKLSKKQRKLLEELTSKAIL